MARAHVLVCLVGILGACVEAPAGQLTAASREDPACNVELLAGLEAFRRDLGLGFEVEAADADALAKTGTVDKRYARDAVQFTVEFGLDAGSGGACTLRLWSITERRPGSTSTQSGDFGTAHLEVCKCT